MDTKNIPTSELLKVKGGLAGGRMTEVSKWFLSSLFELADPKVIANLDDTHLHKFMRLRHHPAGKNGASHVVAYAVFAMDGKYGKDNVGLVRDDFRPIEYNLENITGRHWYKLNCLTTGCRGSVHISQAGMLAIIGQIEFIDPDGVWFACKKVNGCAIL